MGVKIKDAELVKKVTGNERIPVSDGSNTPKTVSVSQIKDYAVEGLGGNDLLALEISEVGEVAVTYGEKSDFVDGQIRETGELVLEFNIE